MRQEKISEEMSDIQRSISFVYFAVIMYLSIYFITNGKVTVTEILAIVIVGTFFYEFLRQFNKNYSTFSNYVLQEKNGIDFMIGTTFTSNGNIIM